MIPLVAERKLYHAILDELKNVPSNVGDVSVSADTDERGYRYGYVVRLREAVEHGRNSAAYATFIPVRQAELINMPMAAFVAEMLKAGFDAFRSLPKPTPIPPEKRYG